MLGGFGACGVVNWDIYLYPGHDESEVNGQMLVTVSEKKTTRADIFLLGQWLNLAKLFGRTYLVGKIKFKLLFQGSIG